MICVLTSIIKFKLICKAKINYINKCKSNFDWLIDWFVLFQPSLTHHWFKGLKLVQKGMAAWGWSGPYLNTRPGCLCTGWTWRSDWNLLREISGVNNRWVQVVLVSKYFELVLCWLAIGATLQHGLSEGDVFACNYICSVFVLWDIY